VIRIFPNPQWSIIPQFDPNGNGKNSRPPRPSFTTNLWGMRSHRAAFMPKLGERLNLGG